MSKQATLFQTWGQKGKPTAGPSTSSAAADTGVDTLDDDEDDEQLLLAIAESLKDVDPSNSSSDNGAGSSRESGLQGTKPYNETQVTKTLFSHGKKPSTSSKPQCGLFSSFGNQSRQPPTNDVPAAGTSHARADDEFDEANLPDISNIPDLPGFDKEAGRMWIYPTNYPVREYQFNIIKAALYENTLVVLPTGLGKTFIAAVVMYNFYRWYPEGKVIFMAPTKPLVAQQIEACYNIMGIPQGDTAEMTGAMQPTERQKSWRRQRVFFLTPQVMVNDLSRGVCPFNDVKCLVVDEAHKALGNHAYCQVVRELIKYSDQFRILCLSATPGGDIKAVQQVINNMLVSHVELRTEDMPDLLPYVHERKVEKIVVPLGEELTATKEQYLRIIGTVVQRLKRHDVIYNKEPQSLSKFLILKAREAFRIDPPENLQYHQKGAIEGDFAMCMSLYHGYELLLQHGLRSLYSFLENVMSGEKGHPRTRAELQRSGDFNNLMDMLRNKFVRTRALLPHTQATQNSDGNVVATGHPKLTKLEEIVVKHFKDFAKRDEGQKTRVMIFAQYRDSVSEITEILNRHKPLVRVMSFIGQSSAGKSSRGFTQKEQLKVMKDFREGGYNTLVSTCVGEEGLDIGDVDLIVCFDAHKSPIRLVQRMGRTGRKREGRIVMLMAEGKEEQIYNQSQCSKRSIHKAILNGTKSLLYYPHNPRMVPDGLTPACHRMHITVHTIFKPTSKSRAAPKQQKNKITSLIDSFTEAKKGNSNSKGSVKSDGFLTPEELSYWSHHFMMTEKVPTVPKPEFVSLSKKGNTDGLPDLDPFDASSCALRLNEWMPWQNRLQPTHKVSHSDKSKQLVELVGFMDLQGAIGEDDNYGQEMALFLNEDDVLPCGQTNRPGILRYCTPKADEENGKKKKSKEKSKQRKRSSLPEFESDVEVNSEDELPGFDKVMRQAAKAPSDLEEAESEVEVTGSQASSKTKRKSSVNKKIVSKTARRIIKTPSGKKIRLNHGLSQSQRRKLHAKKAHRLSQSNQSHINVIEDVNDIDDFDAEVYPMPDIDPVLEAVREAELLETEIEIPQSHSPQIIADNDVVCQQERESDSDFQHDGFVPMEVDPVEDDIFPDFFAKKLVRPSKVTSQRKSDAHQSFSNKKIPVIPPPPTLERLDELMLDLDVKAGVSPIDVLELVEEWGSLLDTRTGPTVLQTPDSGLKLHSGLKSKKTAKKVNIADVPDDLFSAAVLADLEEFNETMEVEDHQKTNSTRDKTPPNDKQDHSDGLEKSEFLPPLMTPRGHLMKQLSSSPLMSVSKLKPPRESSTPVLNPSSVKRLSGSQSKTPDKKTGRLSGKICALGHESFFCDDDDDMLAGIATPPTNQNATFHHSKHDQSVFTFSQALLAVDSVNLESSSSEKTSSSLSPGIEKQKETLNVGSTGNKNKEKDTDMNSVINTTPAKTNLQNPKVGESPHFDLGFDLDDLDESMVIPPSPPAPMSQSLTQKSLAGLVGVKPSKKSIVSFKTTICNNSVNPSSVCDVPAKSAKVADIVEEPGPQVAVVDDKFFDDSAFDESFQLLSNQPKVIDGTKSFTSIKNKQSIPVATVVPLINEAAEVPCNKVASNRDKVASPEQYSITEIPETEFFPEMVEEKQHQSMEETCDDPDSLDESIIAAPKIRRKAAVLLSQASPNVSKRNDDSTFKSPLIVPKRTDARKAVKFMESSDDEDPSHVFHDAEDDDSDFELGPEKPNLQSVKQSKPISKKEKTKKKKKFGGRAFLDEEAELSDEEWSSDEVDNSQMDKMEASFISDGTQLSQQNSEDMRAVYLKSIRSPAIAGKFKLRYQDRPRMDVFSQAPPDEMSEYMQDSFCVDDDEYDSFVVDDIEEEEQSLGEISIMEELVKEKPKKAKKGTGKRKRIVLQSSSSSEQEEGDREMTALKERNKKRLSSERDEGKHNGKAAKDSTDEMASSDFAANAVVKNRQDKIKSVIDGKGSELQRTKSQMTDRRTPADYKKKKTEVDCNVRGTSLLSQNLGSSLASRCHQKLKTAANAGSCANPSATANVPQKTSKPPEVPIFSLGFEDLLDDDFDETCDTNCDTNNTSPNLTEVSQVATFHKSNASNVNTACLNNTRISVMPGSSTKSVAGSTALAHKSAEELRAERLRLSRLKQEQFRQKLQRKTVTQGQADVSSASTHSDAASSSFSILNTSITNKSPNKISVLVDSREIGSAQDIVSELRSKHGLHVEVRQLGTCDYILSNRMAVGRKSITDFTNGANKAKLLERVQLMCKEFERPCIVIEKDRLKPGEEKKNIPLVKSKYVENMLACLANTNIKLVFSDNQAETTNLLAELAQQEERKSFAINVKLQLTPSQNQVLSFYLSLPRVSYITALNLMHNFKTINEFVHSVPGIIARRGVMPLNRAKELSQYLKRTFNPQLIGTKK